MADSRNGTISKVWLTSDVYYPEEASAGYVLTHIAEGLANKYPVHVLCGQPTYGARGMTAPWIEDRRGVKIRRCWGTTFNKDRLPLRAINLLTVTFSIFLHALLRVRKGDKVLVATSPPLLPFAIALVCGLRRAECIHIIHDVYPEVVFATGLLRQNSLFGRVLSALTASLYRSVSRIVVLGRDMWELVAQKLDGDCRRMTIIPNWSEVNLVRPQPRETNRLLARQNLADKFVVQYSGNMGRTHDVEGVLEAAKLLTSFRSPHFLVVGSGAKKAWFDRALAASGLTNVTALQYQPREELCDLLNACDVALIAFLPQMSGVSVPSRMYNVLAAGKPIIAVTEPDSELALVVEEEGIGWVVPPQDPDALARAVLEARSDRNRLEAMGRRARLAAEIRYHLRCMIGAYETVIDELDEQLNQHEMAPVAASRRAA